MVRYWRGKRGFFLGDVGGLTLENRVEWWESDDNVCILSVQLLPGHFGILDCSVAEEALNMRTKPELEHFLLIPGAGVCYDCGIRKVAGWKGCGHELMLSKESWSFTGNILVSA